MRHIHREESSNVEGALTDRERTGTAVNKLQSMSDRALTAQILVLVLCVIGLGAILFAVPDGRWAALPFIICVAGLLGFCGEGYRRWSIRRR